MVGAFVVVSVFPLPSVSDAESLTTYPDLVTGRVLENSFYLAALVLWAAQFIAIGRALDDPTTGRPPIAPWVGAFGLLPLAAGALIHVSTASLSDRYSAPDATPADQEMMVAAWAAGVASSILTTLAVHGLIGWRLVRS